MSAGVIGVADALGSTGLTDLVGSTVANMLGTNVNPFVMIFVFLYPHKCACYTDRIYNRNCLRIRSSCHRYLHKPWT